MGDVVATSFGDEGESTRGDKFAKYNEGVMAFAQDVQAFEKQRLVASGPIDPKGVELQLELEQRRLELEGQRLALVRGLGVRQGMATVLLG